MRRYTKYFNILGRIVKLHVAVYDAGYLAIDSGKPFQDPQYLFVDYDDFYPMIEGIEIIRDYKLRRALIIESSPKHYQLASFSPLPVPILADIYYHSHCDKLHASRLLSRGCVGLRVSCKDGVKPRLIQTLRNYKGTNFYNYDAERAYRKMISEAQDERLSEASSRGRTQRSAKHSGVLGKSNEYMELDTDEGDDEDV